MQELQRVPEVCLIVESLESILLGKHGIGVALRCSIIKENIFGGDHL